MLSSIEVKLFLLFLSGVLWGCQLMMSIRRYSLLFRHNQPGMLRKGLKILLMFSFLSLISFQTYIFVLNSLQHLN